MSNAEKEKIEKAKEKLKRNPDKKKTLKEKRDAKSNK
jgi:hypothetical protein